MLYCASFQLTIISVKAPEASSPVGAGGIDKSPPGTLGIKSSVGTPALGSKGLLFNCLASPLSINSLKVIALSLGSPLLPSLTSWASFIESSVARSSGSVFAGMFLSAGTLVPLVAIKSPLVRL